MRLDIEDVTIFQPNLRTINQDAREKIFSAHERTEN